MSLLSRVIRAATPENPRFNLLDPQAWDALGPSKTSSGFRVDREIAATHSPWFRGCNLLATDVAKVHFHLLQGNKKATNHPAYYLLRWKPNAFQNAFTFRRQLVGQAVSGGNAYALINRRGDGSPMEILPLDPAVTFPVRENGVLHYVTTADGQSHKLAWNDVIHLMGWGHDGLQGYNVIDKAREVLGLGMGARKYQSIFFKNNGRAAVVLEAPIRLDDKAKNTLRTNWDSMHAGLDNAHRTAVLDMGLRARVISFNAEDSALIDTRKFDLIDIANFIGIPPHKLGANENASYNTLEQEDQAYLDTSLDPWLVQLEFIFWDKLLAEEEKLTETHQVVAWRKGLVRADLAARAAYNKMALGGLPWRTVNEVRDEEGDDPVDRGDTLPRPLNMDYGENLQTTDPVDPVPPPSQPLENTTDILDTPTQAHTWLPSLIRDHVARMSRRISRHAERAATAPKKFLDWVDALEKNHGPACRESLASIDQVGNRFAQVVPTQRNSLADWFLARARDEYLELSGRVTSKNLASEVANLNATLADRLPAEAVARYFPEVQK